MSILRWTTFAAAIVGDDLYTAAVSGSVLGVRTRSGPVLRSFLSLSPGEAARQLAGMTGTSRAVLVVPSAWCGLRPIALSTRKWDSARDEIRKSIQSLFPLASDQALVGLVNRSGTGDAGGYLIVADRRKVEPWTRSIEQALGRAVSAVVSPHMIFSGLGLQGVPEAEVLERLASGAMAAHRLDRAEIVELGAPLDVEAPRRADFRRWTLPGAGVGAEALGGAPITGAELAIASVLAPRVAPRSFAPLSGKAPSPTRRWLPAAAALALAAVAYWGAQHTETLRFEAAIARLDEQERAGATALADARDARDKARKFVGLLGAVSAQMPAGAQPVSADLFAVQRALPEGGFLYRIELEEKSVTVRGEARRAGDVLRALEDAPEFQGARELDTPVTVEERGLEMFSIRADRTPGAVSQAPPRKEAAE